MWHRFEGDTSAFTSNKVSMQTIPESLRPLVYSQQLSRYLNLNDKLAPHLRLPAVLLRMMARANKIESSSMGYLSPSMLLLFVLRYDQELYETLRGDYSCNYMDHFSFAKNICRRFSDFDYCNYVWHIDGDKKASGNSLRVLHPFYPDHCLTSAIT